MSKFDLANANDFAKLTLSNAGQALLVFGGSVSEWDIQEAAYGHKELILFHVFKSNSEYDAAVSQVTDTEGRRKAIYEFPYRDGQTTDDLGRKGSSYEFNILLFGSKYKSALAKLKKEFNDPRPGILMHPVYGRLNVVADDWSIIHESSSRNSASVRVRFVEHNFDFSLNFASKDVKSKIAAALAFFKKIDDILATVNGSILLIQTVKNLITIALSSFKTDYANTLVKLNTTYNLNGSDDFPSLLPTNEGGSDTVFQVVQSPSDPFASVPIETLEESTFAALASEQAIDAVKSLRDTLNVNIANLADCLEGEGALEFADEILELKNSGIAIQEVLETGLKSSNLKVLNYTTTRISSIREVCFENGLSPDRSIELELLNPQLLSVNKIPVGTVLKVPSA